MFCPYLRFCGIFTEKGGNINTAQDLEPEQHLETTITPGKKKKKEPPTKKKNNRKRKEEKRKEGRKKGKTNTEKHL